jgi:hypothetical protein
VEEGVMIEPHQGPREPLRSRPILPRQRYLLDEAILLLEQCQKDMHEVDGDSKERTRVCKVLESLYQLSSLAARLAKR